jgi:transposase InsO family protein
MWRMRWTSIRFVHRRSFASDAQLNALPGGYIERFYNLKRIHFSLGYHSPVEFECLANAWQYFYQIG